MQRILVQGLGPCTELAVGGVEKTGGDASGHLTSSKLFQQEMRYEVFSLDYE